MSTSVSRPSRTTGKSIFFQDLATPISTNRGKFTSPGQAAAVSALWRENFGGTDPPPPPVFTLEDRIDFSPESGIMDYPMSSESKSDMRTPTPVRRTDSLRSRFHGSGGGGSGTPFSIVGGGGQRLEQSPGSSSWWSPGKSGSEYEEREKEKGKGSPVEGVVQPGALIMLPPPREVARPEMKRNDLPAGDHDEEEWVTVYGFSPGDTNLVLREFEKCGTVLKHVPGPRNANWMHILYQNRFDAQKALCRNGTVINGVLIIGVKPLDPVQRLAMTQGLNNRGFMTTPSTAVRSTELIPSLASAHHYNVQNNIHATPHASGVIASPAKSRLSKIMDVMFGI